MGDLLGGANGYILSKASATDMDFTWIPNDQGDITGVTAGNGISVTSPTGPVPTVAIDTSITVDKTTAQTLTNKTLTSPALTTPTISTATTNGDLLYGTGSGALQRLGIGSASQILSVSGGIPAWTTPAASASGLTFIKRSTFNNVTTTTTTFDSIFTSTYKAYFVVIETATGSGGADFRCQYRVGGVTQTTAYYGAMFGYNHSASLTVVGDSGTTSFRIGQLDGSSISSSSLTFTQVGFSSSPKVMGTLFDANRTLAGSMANTWGSGNINADGLIFSASSGNINGTIAIYGLAAS